LYVLNSGAGPAAFNMALDEVLMEAVFPLRLPVLRFYGWLQPAATLGYFQRYEQVAALTPLRPLIRRPTGGGVVPHDSDWTYSLAVPSGVPWYELSAIESYRAIHEWIRRSFEILGIEAFLAGSEKAGMGQCFAGYEKFDVLYQGRKIAGAAQRRTKTALLIQGSVQPPAAALSRFLWEQAFTDTAVHQNFASTTLQLGPGLLEKAEQLARDKYSQAAYNRKR